LLLLFFLQFAKITFFLFFYIGTNFKTPKLHRTVRASDLAYQSRGDYQADYLSIEHNSVVELRDEFILVGREANTGKVFSRHAEVGHVT